MNTPEVVSPQQWEAARQQLLGKEKALNLAHLNARNTTLAYASRAPQADIQRLKAQMAWEHIPWYTITDDFQEPPYAWWRWHDAYDTGPSREHLDQIARVQAAEAGSR